MRRFAGTVTWRCGVTPEAIAAWTPPATGRRGRPARYSDVAIETGLMLRLAFGRPWRQTEGLLGSLMRLLGLDLEVPDHTTFSRRSADREVASALARTDGSVTVIIDSTGLKVFRVRTHKEPFRQGAVVIQRPGKGLCDERRSVLVDGGAVRTA